MNLYLNDMGVIGPIGAGKADVLARLLAADGSGMEPYVGLLTGRSTVIGRVREHLPATPLDLTELDCRNNRLLAHALDQIAAPIADLRDTFGADRIAVVLGTSTSGISAGEDALATHAREGRMPDDLSLPPAGDRHGRGIRGAVSEVDGPALYDFHGVLVVRQGIRVGVAVVRHRPLRCRDRGRCRQPLQADAERVRRARVAGARSLQSVQRESSRHQHRRGRVRLRRVESSPPPCVSRGVGESSDGHHISAPDPSGRGAEAAIRAALAHAGAQPEAVGYVNLHGTATPKNDEMESQVMARVFGLDVPCSSTKSLSGHTLGAAGALELGFCWLLLSDANVRRRLPAHTWDGARDRHLPPINLVGDDARWERDLFVSNSFAFGGSNAAVAVGRA